MTTRDEILYDVRTLDRKVRKGLVSKKDLEKYLKGLPDRSDNVAPIEDTEQGGAAGEDE